MTTREMIEFVVTQDKVDVAKLLCLDSEKCEILLVVGEVSNIPCQEEIWCGSRGDGEDFIAHALGWWRWWGRGYSGTGFGFSGTVEPARGEEAGNTVERGHRRCGLGTGENYWFAPVGGWRGELEVDV